MKLTTSPYLWWFPDWAFHSFWFVTINQPTFVQSRMALNKNLDTWHRAQSVTWLVGSQHKLILNKLSANQVTACVLTQLMLTPQHEYGQRFCRHQHCWHQPYVDAQILVSSVLECIMNSLCTLSYMKKKGILLSFVRESEFSWPMTWIEKRFSAHIP